MTKLRVWHVPQMPMTSFKVEVSSVQEGVKLMDILADYDAFQLRNNIKPDYCNVNGLQMWDDTLTDTDLKEIGLKDKWVDWYFEDDEGIWECPREYLQHQRQKANQPEEVAQS